MSDVFTAIDVSARGLSVQRAKMNVVAENIANAETTRTPEGGPYRRQRVTVTENSRPTSFNSEISRATARLNRTNTRHLQVGSSISVNKTEVPTADLEVGIDKLSNFRPVYDPSHPQADEEGYVMMPDIEIVNEMVDMMAASRAYEANTSAIAAAKQMAKDALDI